ncbi:Histone deacetylase complex subunit SAP18 [Psilocybe cubensis]|uniref:Histone deacetylase complex subunit SAP18 n=2 Tax=Psilocybe cubensis TaxID=181762 RepID=A0ACB8H296_PSICU|nr:Histone deacetylase complex subunit SAP18 [Psilocybe cubensis]KAH9482140.1 Histone deacetylase complex subunit SAP18 [Psilocybe cubensis]
MDAEDTQTSGHPSVSREKTAPFLIRTFVKIGSFHRNTLFEDGSLPTTDEQQIFTWKDATLREVLTTLRNTAPHVAEYKHPLARFSFRTVFPDPNNKGRFTSKDIGMVYSRDILGEPGTLTSTAPRLLQDTEPPARGHGEREREERTLDELRFYPGDYLLIAVLLPKNVNLPSETSIKGSGAGAPVSPTTGWRAGGPAAKSDAGWGRAVGTGPGLGRGGGHWRGDSNAPGPAVRGGRGGGRGGDSGRDRDLDRSDTRVPPPRRHDSPPRGGGWGDRDRGGRGGRGGNRRSPSRSRSPPRRRRYD